MARKGTAVQVSQRQPTKKWQQGRRECCYLLRLRYQNPCQRTNGKSVTNPCANKGASRRPSNHALSLFIHTANSGVGSGGALKVEIYVIASAHITNGNQTLHPTETARTAALQAPMLDYFRNIKCERCMMKQNFDPNVWRSFSPDLPRSRNTFVPTM